MAASDDAGLPVPNEAEGGPAVECSVCGRPTTLLIGDMPICEQCYENAGSCCLEFGGDDLWQGREDDSDGSRSRQQGQDGQGEWASAEKRF
jgi:hypothetical protein